MARETTRRNDLARESNRRRALWLPGVGAVVVLAVLAGLTLGGTPAQANFPGLNGKLFCEEAAAPGGTAKDVDIFSINPDGTGRTLVTDNTFINPSDPASGFLNDFQAAISADGKRMAFISNRDGVLSVYVMNADGTGPATRVSTPATNPLGEVSFADIVPTWTPDGKKILYTALFPNGNGEIYIVNADGSNPINLTKRTTQEVAPAVSPDGKKILFHSNRNITPTTARDQDIYSMDLDGSNVQNLTNDSNANALDVFPTWSPDGKRFVFERGQNSGTSSFAFSNVFTMNADGTGTPTQLTFATAGLNRNPAWSPDGTRISFDSERDNPPAPEPRNREAYTMKTDGSDVRRVTNAPGSDAQCDWQTIPRPAVVGPPPVYPVPVPTAAKLKTSLTLKAKPKRDKRLPFRYGFSGTVKIPAGVAKATVCGGKVKLRLKKGAKTVAKGTARVSKSCTYKKRVTIRTAKRTGTKRGRLKVTAGFGGNARLKSSKKSTTVRFF